VIQPGDQHWRHFQQMLRSGSTVGNLVADAHLAALAMEHNCVLHSPDADFSRFRGLKWRGVITQSACCTLHFSDPVRHRRRRLQICNLQQTDPRVHATPIV